MSVAAITLMLAAAAPSDGSQKAPPASLVASIDARIEKVKQRRIALENEINRLQNEEKGLLREIERLDLAVRLRGTELRELRLVFERANLDLDRTLRRVREIESDLDQARPLVVARARALYKLGRLSYLRLLLSVERPAAILEGFRYVTALARKDNERIAKFRRDLKALNDTREELVRRTQDVQSLRIETRSQRQRLNAERIAKRSFLRDIVASRETNDAFLDELSEAEQRLRQLLSGFEEGPVSVPVSVFKGSLPWPVTGRVRVPFGRRKHPRFSTYTIQNGIEIEAAPDAAVTAVHDGTVVFSDRLLGYGLLVVIDHGGRHLSLYGRLSDANVRVGDQVTAGQVVGSVGAGLQGPGLYFEMRFQGKPENPMDWLRRSHL
ncbi:MAG: peptidoglycan DD-metalloendopeptidase family protein [Vicinamibacteria bacterium]|nr:peptidoglycan DD-metalloendopeptidase family protein [Vicinamibacteria bacterium]